MRHFVKLTVLFMGVCSSVCYADRNTVGPISPISPPVKATTKEDIQLVKDLLKQGAQHRKDVWTYKIKGHYCPVISGTKVGEIGVILDSTNQQVYLRPIKTVQIVDDENMLIDIGGNVVVWLNGFPTKGLTDGDEISSNVVDDGFSQAASSLDLTPSLN
jgi:hypothetical protein